MLINSLNLNKNNSLMLNLKISNLLKNNYNK